MVDDLRTRRRAAVHRLTSVPRAVALAVLALVVMSVDAAAQYRFDVWTVDNGLPQNIITAVHQTRDGYLWVATLDGLARFDGVRFTIFDKSTAPGILSNRFTSLYEDAQGDLWLGTESSGVTRYRQGRFETWSAERGGPTEFVFGFVTDAAGAVIAITPFAMKRWAPEVDRFVDLETPRFTTGYHELVFKERPGVWARDAAGLHRFERGVWKIVPWPSGWRGPNAPLLAQAQDGAWWFGEPGGPPVRVEPGTPATFAPANQVSHRDRHGTVWQFEVDEFLRRSLVLPTSDGPRRLPFTLVYEDREGHLWLGTNGQGLYRVRRQLVTSYSQAQGLVDRNVYPILEDREGGVWIGGWERGVSRYWQGRFINYTTKEGLLPYAVTALANDRDGQVWIATREGLQVWRDGQLRTIDNRFVPRRAVVNVMHQDREGAMWFGTDFGVVRLRDGTPTLLTTRDGLVADNTRVIIDRAAGGLWIGAYGGLTRIDAGGVARWTARDGLPGDSIRALYEDADGVLWIGTYDSGLGRFADGRFTRYTTREGLTNDGVFQILEDAQGHLWTSGNRGITRLSKMELTELAAGRRTRVNAVAYGQDAGMLNVECNGGLWPAGIEARDGRLWFPTQDGVAVIDPRTIAPNRTPPPVAIESVLIDRAPVPFDVPVHMAPAQTDLEIAYTALSFVNSSRIRFRYKLEGVDRDWVMAGARRTAYYSRVPAGDFTFHVTAANDDGVWNEEGRRLQIRVTPPFYRRVSFLALAAIGVLGAAALWHRDRLARVRAAHAAQAEFSRRLLESQERERQRIAGELHDSLGQQLLVIRNRAMLGERGADDPARARSQFDEITTSAALAIDEVRTISHNLRPVNLDRLGLTASLEEMIEKVASAGGLQLSADIEPLDGLLSKADEINCYRIVQESLNNIVKHAGATKAYVEIWREEGELRVTVRDNGRGFDAAPRQGAIHAARGAGLGLTSIAERARIMGGTLIIDAAPGEGTTLNVRLPAASPSTS
jgi:signal transduction histidine kinase/ligand-binding sensor domain-containing protein